MRHKIRVALYNIYAERDLSYCKKLCFVSAGNS